MRFKKFSYIIASLLFVSTLLYAQESYALGIPTIDMKSITNGLKNTFNTIKESKFVVDTVAFVQKTTAAIGDAAKSVNEYVVKNVKKAQKKMEKLEKYKEDYEKYKEDYEEYKRQLDEGIAKAKEYKAEAEKLKADIEGGIATAKELKDVAKGMTAGASDMLNSKLSGATGGKLGGSGNDTDIDAVTQTAGNMTAATSGVAAGAAAGGAISGLNKAGTVKSISGDQLQKVQMLDASGESLSEEDNTLTPAVSSRQTFGKASVAKTSSGTVATLNSGVISGAGNVASGGIAGESLKGVMNAPVQADSTTSSNGLNNMDMPLAGGIVGTDTPAALNDLARDGTQLLAPKAGLAKNPKDSLKAKDAAIAWDKDTAEQKDKEAATEDEKDLDGADAKKAAEDIENELLAKDAAKKAALAENDNSEANAKVEEELKSKDEQKKSELESAKQNSYSWDESENALKAQDDAKKSALNKSGVSSRRSFGRK